MKKTNYFISQYLVEMLDKLITDDDTRVYLSKEYNIVKQCVIVGAESLFKDCYYLKYEDEENDE